MKIALLGVGAWGSALAKLLLAEGHQIMAWDHDLANLRAVAASGRNEKYLPGVPLGAGLVPADDPAAAWPGCDCVIVAVPSKGIRCVADALAGFAGPVVSVTKGIEYETGLTMSAILRAAAPTARVAALSGPTLALEVARGVPTAAVVASADEATAGFFQRLFHRPTFRIYTSPDPLGVELGGALKNVIAIAAGLNDGLGFGDNSKAALVTRGIAEIRRLGVACGARPETFSGLSGLGDLVVTCFSPLSRNRTLGEQLGRGARLEDLLARAVSVAEGYPTARAARALARRHEVPVPIIDEVYAVLYEAKPPAAAVRDLLARVTKPED
jgi:glycerol-3-phosphate dehydrogenase (NAD(P)+)